MKKTIFFLLLITPIISFSQKKLDNTIIIHEVLPAQKIKSILFLNGYTFNNTDTIYINTEQKLINGGAMAIKLSIAIMDSVIYIKGFCRATAENFFGKDEDFKIVDYSKLFGKTLPTWKEVDKIAKELSDKITYTKQ